MSKIKIEHPILHRINSIKSDYIEGVNEEDWSHDPQEFLNQLWERSLENCENCPLHTLRTRVTKWDGRAPSPIAIVLESPGALENASGVPLVGPMELRGSICSQCKNVYSCYDHKIINKPTNWGKKNKIIECLPNLTSKQILNTQFYLRSSGAIIDGILLNEWKFQFPRYNWVTQYNERFPDNDLNLESPFFITNAVMCRSTDEFKLKDKTPESIHIAKCRKWLAWQLSAVQPKIIIAFGRVSAASLLGNSKEFKSLKIFDMIDSKFGKVIYMPHPAAIMREDNKEYRAYGYGKIKTIFELALQESGLL